MGFTVLRTDTRMMVSGYTVLPVDWLKGIQVYWFESIASYLTHEMCGKGVITAARAWPDACAAIPAQEMSGVQWGGGTEHGSMVPSRRSVWVGGRRPIAAPRGLAWGAAWASGRVVGVAGTAGNYAGMLVEG